MGTQTPRQDSGVTITAGQQMISSCSGAILTSLFVTPLDVVKIRLQVQQKPENFTCNRCFLYCNGLWDHLCPYGNGNGNGNGNINNASRPLPWYKRPVEFNGRRPIQFNGMMHALQHIGRHEGFASLWSGLPPTLVMAVPATVVYFTCYEQVKSLLGHNYYGSFSDNWWKPVAAGATARVWAATLISPLEMIRTKMQSEKLTYTDLGQALRTAVQQQGVRSLWMGLGPTLLRDVPFSALYWLGYDNMKTYRMSQRGTTQLTFMESFVVGALAGTSQYNVPLVTTEKSCRIPFSGPLICWVGKSGSRSAGFEWIHGKKLPVKTAGVITLPFDVIKTHRQIELGRIVFAHEKREVSSTWMLIRQLYRSQGISALFAGLAPRIVKVAPACAIMISSYEFFKKFFKRLNEEKASHTGLHRS